MRIYILALLTTAFFIGCSAAEKSASQVLNNANSVVKTTSENLWVDPDPTDDVPAVSSGATQAVDNAGSAVKQTADDIGSNQDKIWAAADEKEEEISEDLNE